MPSPASTCPDCLREKVRAAGLTVVLVWAGSEEKSRRRTEVDEVRAVREDRSRREVELLHGRFEGLCDLAEVSRS